MFRNYSRCYNGIDVSSNYYKHSEGICIIMYIVAVNIVLGCFQKNISNEQCIEFSHDEYRKIYTLLDNATNISVSDVAHQYSEKWLTLNNSTSHSN